MADTRSPFLFSAVLSFPLAALLAAGALAGVTQPVVYAREAPLWAAQGIGQDWVDLLVVAPCLVACAALALRGSRLFALLMGGTLVYAMYSLVLYNFAMHFNVLFLVYTFALGLAFYALVGSVIAFSRANARAWFDDDVPVRLAAGYAILLGVAFSVLWLSEVVPSLASGTAPGGLREVGLITNPVHVLDLGIVLPAFVAGGVALLGRRSPAFWLVPVMLMFGVLMDLALVGMAVSMAARNMASGPPAPVFAVLAAITASILWAFLRHLRPRDTVPNPTS